MSSRKEAKAPDILRGAAWSVVNAMLSIAAPFFMFTISALHLSPGEVGSIATTVALCELVKMIAPQGLYEVLMSREIDDRRRRAALATLLLGGMAASVIHFLILTYIVAAAHLSAASKLPLYLLCFKPLFDVAALFYQSELARQLKFRHVAFRSIGANISASVTGALLVLYVNPVLGMVMYYVVMSVFGFIIVFWGSGVRETPLFEWALIRRQPGEVWYSTAVRNLGTTNNYIDQFITGFFVTPALLGFFSFGKRFETALITGGGSLANIVYQPIFSQARERERADQTLAATLALSNVMIVTPVLVFTFHGHSIIETFFGTRWLPAVPFTQMLMISGALRVIGQIYGSYLSVRGYNKKLFNISLVSAIIAIGALSLTPWIGLEFAVFLVLLRNAVTMLVMAVTAYGRSKPLVIHMLAHSLGPTALTLATFWFTSSQMPLFHGLGLLSEVAMHAVIALLVFSVFNHRAILRIRQSMAAR